MADDVELSAFLAEIAEIAQPTSAPPAPPVLPALSPPAPPPPPRPAAAPRSLAEEAAAEDALLEASARGHAPPRAFAPRAVVSRPAVITRAPVPAPAAEAPAAASAAAAAAKATAAAAAAVAAAAAAGAAAAASASASAPPYSFGGGYGGGYGGGGGGGATAGKKRPLMRSAAGETWADPTLADWPTDDYRLYVANLGPEASEDLLVSSFSKYRSFHRARVVKPKVGQGGQGKVRPYGFLSFLDPWDALAALKEMDGAYVGSRPVTLKKSNWKERNAEPPEKRGKQGGAK